MTKISNSWFTVDRKGLSHLVANRDKSFIVNELLQNAWDQNVSRVSVALESSDVRGYTRLHVYDDDPNGFSDLAHSFTLFAESEKKSDATKRGRFNLGEKLVLSICAEAEIETVGRTVTFSSEGKRRVTKNKRISGSRFSALFKMTKVECEEVLRGCSRLIPPKGIVTTINGVPLRERVPVCSFDIQMPTVAMGDEGNLFTTKRITKVDIYEPFGNETATIYEMGIPVVCLEEDRFHVDVQQKVPLNMDRDNVSPSYLRRLRMAVVNHTAGLLTQEDSSSTWVAEGTGHKEATKEAVTKVLDLRYGEKRVLYDPSDSEANALAVSSGYTVIHGRSLTADQHHNVREFRAVLPAGQVTPSPKPYSEDGTPLPLAKNVTPEMRAVETLAKQIAHQVLEASIDVVFVSKISWRYLATYGENQLTFNLGTLGYGFFKPNNLREIIDLVIHEFGHHYEGNHLSENYYNALTKIGAGVAIMALEDPEKFNLKLLEEVKQ